MVTFSTRISILGKEYRLDTYPILAVEPKGRKGLRLTHSSASYNLVPSDDLSHWVCTCPAYKYRPGEPCKHGTAVWALFAQILDVFPKKAST